MISKFPGGKSTIHQTDEEDRVIAYLTPSVMLGFLPLKQRASESRGKSPMWVSEVTELLQHLPLRPCCLHSLAMKSQQWSLYDRGIKGRKNSKISTI